MNQPSLFSAETLPPELADLGGLLAAHGQVTAASGGARLSILLSQRWRATALVDECVARGIAADAVDAAEVGAAADMYDGILVDAATTLLRTERTEVLELLATDWTRGAVKAVPEALLAGAGLLRLWLIAAGRQTPGGYVLGLDPHAPGTHQRLAAVCARAGLAGAIVGAASDTPVIRLTGRRRLRRLLELVGGPPRGAPGDAWPAQL
ncbi:MAG: hypothetical protein ABI382_05315 [Nakamurella sp.]